MALPTLKHCNLRSSPTCRLFDSGCESAPRSRRRDLLGCLALKVSVALETGDVIRDEHVRVLPRDAGSVRNLAPESGEQVRRAELDVVEHLSHSVAVYEVSHLVASTVRLRQSDVHRVRVAEQIVQVAQDLLIGARQKNPDDVGITVVERVKLEALLRSAVPD